MREMWLEHGGVEGDCFRGERGQWQLFWFWFGQPIAVYHSDRKHDTVDCIADRDSRASDKGKLDWPRFPLRSGLRLVASRAGLTRGRR